MNLNKSKKVCNGKLLQDLEKFITYLEYATSLWRERLEKIKEEEISKYQTSILEKLENECPN